MSLSVCSTLSPSVSFTPKLGASIEMEKLREEFFICCGVHLFMISLQNDGIKLPTKYVAEISFMNKLRPYFGPAAVA